MPLPTKTTSDDKQTAACGTANRRRGERIQTPFPACVQGVDVNHEAFEVSTVVDNFSARGLYLRLSQHVEKGAKITITARLSTSQIDKSSGPVVLLRSKVLRIEPKPGGVYGLALAIMHRCFL